MSKSTSRHTPLPTLPEAVEALTATNSFSGNDSLAHAGRVMMAKHVAKLYHHLPGVQTGDDPHDVHQMRVATRRLRASLEATATAYKAKRVQELRKRLRTLARVLGEVRDRDVLLMRLRKDAAQQAKQPVIEKLEVDEAQDELNVVIERLQVERDKAHTALLRELSRKRTARLLHDLNDFLTSPLVDVQATDNDLPLLVHHHAGSAIWHEYESVRRFETVMPNAPSEQLHELRIACKHLRYTVELFEPALGESARGLIKQVTAMQEHLGDLHDADVALLYLADANHHDHMADESNDEAQSGNTRLTAYVASRTAERESLLAGVEPLWNELNGNTIRQTLAQVLVTL